jgi:flagellar biosynthesis/type III secretory pathway ATPase
MPLIEAFLRQEPTERCAFDATVASLREAVR